MTAIEESARIAAVEASADGISWTFSPMVEISRDLVGDAYPKVVAKTRFSVP